MGVATPPAARPTPIWRKALQLVRANRKATMLPLLVTQAPLSVARAVAYVVLLAGVYPDDPYPSFDNLLDLPAGLLFSMAMVEGVYWLFTLVGLAGTVVAVSRVRSGAAALLSSSLDPAFTRLGSILGLGVLFYVLVAGTLAGILLLPYFIIRLGLAFQVCVLEGERPWRSIRRSWSLLRGNILRFTALLLVTMVIGAVALAVVVVFSATVVVLFIGEDPGRTVEVTASSVLVIAAGLAAVPIGAYFTAATTLFYYDARERADDRRLA